MVIIITKYRSDMNNNRLKTRKDNDFYIIIISFLNGYHQPLKGIKLHMQQLGQARD